jgi:hypothetical protein
VSPVLYSIGWKFPVYKPIPWPISATTALAFGLGTYERGVSSLLHVDWLGTDALLYGRASASVSRMRRSKLSGLGCAVVPWPILGVKVGHLSGLPIWRSLGSGTDEGLPMSVDSHAVTALGYDIEAALVEPDD